MADVESVADLINRCEIAEFGSPDEDVEEVRGSWEKLDLDHDLFLVVDGEGVPAAIVWLDDHSGKAADFSGYVDPDDCGKGLGNAILDWCDRRMEGFDAGSRPPLIRHWISAWNRPAADLMASRGYRQSKRFVRMHIDLASAPVQPNWPDRYALKSVDFSQDLPGFYEVIVKSFSDHWADHERTYERWREANPEPIPELWLQLFQGDTRVGVAYGRFYDDVGWISVIGVLADHRGQGLGSALLRELIHRFWETGCRQVELGLDEENSTSARHLYENAGMTVNRSHEAWEKPALGADQVG